MPTRRPASIISTGTVADIRTQTGPEGFGSGFGARLASVLALSGGGADSRAAWAGQRSGPCIWHLWRCKPKLPREGRRAFPASWRCACQSTPLPGHRQRTAPPLAEPVARLGGPTGPWCGRTGRLLANRLDRDGRNPCRRRLLRPCGLRGLGSTTGVLFRLEVLKRRRNERRRRRDCLVSRCGRRRDERFRGCRLVMRRRAVEPGRTR